MKTVDAVAEIVIVLDLAKTKLSTAICGARSTGLEEVGKERRLPAYLEFEFRQNANDDKSTASPQWESATRLAP